jgi:hypothetical protein
LTSYEFEDVPPFCNPDKATFFLIDRTLQAFWACLVSRVSFGSHWVIIFEPFGFLGYPALLHIMVLKTPSDQTREECSSRLFPASHPRLRKNRQRRVPAEPPRGDGASSSGTAKNRRDEFDHRPQNFVIVYRASSFMAKPHFDLNHPSRSSDMVGSPSPAR